MAQPRDEQRRPLRLLVGSPDGCTTLIIMAHGLMPENAATKPETVRVGQTSIEVVRMHVTAAGRKAIAD